MDYINNSHLHTVCDVKQPIVFSYFTEFNEVKVSFSFKSEIGYMF